MAALAIGPGSQAATSLSCPIVSRLASSRGCVGSNTRNNSKRVAEGSLYANCHTRSLISSTLVTITISRLRIRPLTFSGKNRDCLLV